MAIRSLNEIWVDANFKETQLGDLRIGQPVDLYVDMYGGRQVFKGRISGFTMGTGSTLALLPAQNATGNFVKVVQRLPVRIDLAGLRSGQEPAVHRHVGCSLRLLSTSRRPDPTPGSFCKPLRLNRQTDGSTASPPGAKK